MYEASGSGVGDGVTRSMVILVGNEVAANTASVAESVKSIVGSIADKDDDDDNSPSSFFVSARS